MNISCYYSHLPIGWFINIRKCYNLKNNTIKNLLRTMYINSDYSYVDRCLKPSFYKNVGFISNFSVGMYVYIEFICFMCLWLKQERSCLLKWISYTFDIFMLTSIYGLFST